VLSPFLFPIYLDDIPTTRSLTPKSVIVLYADDILLIAPSINELQLRLFQDCEKKTGVIGYAYYCDKIMLSAYWSKI